MHGNAALEHGPSFFFKQYDACCWNHMFKIGFKKEGVCAYDFFGRPGSLPGQGQGQDQGQGPDQDQIMR